MISFYESIYSLYIGIRNLRKTKGATDTRRKRHQESKRISVTLSRYIRKDKKEEREGS